MVDSAHCSPFCEFSVSVFLMLSMVFSSFLKAVRAKTAFIGITMAHSSSHPHQNHAMLKKSMPSGGPISGTTHTVSGIAYPNYEYGYGLINAEAGVEYIRTHFANPTHLHGVETVDANNANTIYSISGQRISDLTDRHGIFVITKDGKARKVIR